MNKIKELYRPLRTNHLFGLSLALLIAVDLCLLLFRFAYSGSFNNWYLAWNLFLGCLPLLFSYLFFKNTQQKLLYTPKNALFIGLWILFLPNAFYLISDLVHLQESSNKMIVFDAVMFLAFGITGIILGFLSLALMQFRLAEISKKYSLVLIAGSLFVSSYAIYLGRYLRWNSWDVITNPFGIIFDISNSFINYNRFAKSLGTTVLFFTILIVLYFVFWSGVLFVKELPAKKSDKIVLVKELSKKIEKIIQELFGIEVAIELTVPDEAFGDYSTNVAMQLVKKVGKNPRELAEQIKLKLSKADTVKSVTIAGPGFINILLTDEALIKNWSSDAPKIYKDKVVIAEYSDPNAFKALHAGHLYTTLVGNAIANIIESAGAKLYRLNYGGDVGLHVARAMYGILNKIGGENPERLKNVPIKERPLWLSQRYVEGSSAYENNENAKIEIEKLNKRIYAIFVDHDKDSKFAQIYWTCRNWSYEGFEELYKSLGVKPFDEFIPESTVTPLGIKTVESGLNTGIFEKSDGAIIYSEAKSNLHTRVFITSKGLPLYEAKELGLAVYKWEKYHFDKSLVITANDITEYMKVLFSAMSSFYPEVEQRTVHLTHGMIKLSGGRKMSSRRGNVLMANDIINDAISANQELSGNVDDDIAIGAIKYAFLKQRLGGDIIYDPEESVSLHGNSGPYLMYAHARARSILEKSNGSSEDIILPLTVYERSLARSLTHYNLYLSKSIDDLMPHHICTYLYELAQVFNRFYENSKVIGDERESLRITLVSRYADTLKNGLEILGIKAPNKM